MAPEIPPSWNTTRHNEAENFIPSDKITAVLGLYSFSPLPAVLEARSIRYKKEFCTTNTTRLAYLYGMVVPQQRTVAEVRTRV